MYPAKKLLFGDVKLNPQVKKAIRLIPLTMNIVAGATWFCVGLVMRVGGTIHFNAENLTSVDVPQNTIISWILIIGGIWFMFVSPRLQLKINKWFPKGLRRLWS